jgi:PLD-like domain
MGASQSDSADPGTVINATADPTQTLQSFTLDDLAQFTLEQRYSDNASKDFHLFYVGRDDVHEILKYILSRARVSLYLNMFGFDDDELNTILMEKAKDPNVTMLVTLDKSQAGGKHERQLIELDQSTEDGLAAFNTHFVIGQSATHQISHTKGFVADSKVGAEGSTNWSASGEGTFIVTGHPGGSGYKAQNNTQSVFTDTDTIARFQAELVQEHLAAQKGGPVEGSAGAQREPPRPRRRATKVTPEEPS